MYIQTKENQPKESKGPGTITNCWKGLLQERYRSLRDRRLGTVMKPQFADTDVSNMGHSDDRPWFWDRRRKYKIEG